MNKYKKDFISVIMPTHNAGDFLVEAIESIINQTYKNFEFIIINDASTDNTAKVLKKYQHKYPEIIKIITLKSKHGAFLAANRGIRISKGEFIAPMDSDDISKPQRLEKEINFLRHNPEYIVVGTQANIINSKGKITGVKKCPQNSDEIKSMFFEYNPIVHPSCMIRRMFMPEKNTLYRNKYGVNDDYYTLFVLLKFGKFANLPQVLFNYRIHKNNSSLQNIKQKFFNSVRIRIKAITDLNYKPSIKSTVKMLSQIMVVTLIPESMILKLYFFIRGINSPSVKFSFAFDKFNIFITKAKNYSYSLINTITSL